MWKESNRFALFPYPLENLPKSLLLVGQFSNAFDLFQAVKLLVKRFPNKSISNEPFKTMLLTDYTFEIAVNDFKRFFPNIQLKLWQ